MALFFLLLSPIYPQLAFRFFLSNAVILVVQSPFGCLASCFTLSVFWEFSHDVLMYPPFFRRRCFGTPFGPLFVTIWRTFSLMC